MPLPSHLTDILKVLTENYTRACEDKTANFVKGRVGYHAVSYQSGYRGACRAIARELGLTEEFQAATKRPVDDDDVYLARELKSYTIEELREYYTSGKRGTDAPPESQSLLQLF